MAHGSGAGSRLPAGGRSVGIAAVDLDEVDLIGRVAAEDVGAFEDIYRAYHPRLTRFLKGMLRQPALVDEVLDDTMLVVWRKAHTYNASSKLSTWIFAIAYRTALKALKRIEPAYAAEADEPASPPQSGPDGQMQLQQLRVRLGDALQTLSAEHRAVIELTYFQGHSCREIAEIMGCPTATVKTRMFYARHKLKSLLIRQGEQAL